MENFDTTNAARFVTIVVCISLCLLNLTLIVFVFVIPDEIVIPDREWEEFKFDVPWGFIAGKWYGDRNKQPLLAFHGWQDNCGTFDRLIPLLPKTIPVLAIDLPGHGRSSHFPTGMQYHM